MPQPSISQDFIFREEGDKLVFVGDFERLYQKDPDPWEQSGEAKLYSVTQYYNSSRARLVDVLRRRAGGSTLRGLEVGCGHGHVVDCLAGSLNQVWEGMDISHTAVAKAAELYSKHMFYCGDVIHGLPGHIKYDTIVLGQLFWYVMHDMEKVVKNCYEALTPKGLLVISQAFLSGEQRYGREIADGFDGAVRLLLQFKQFQLLEARYEDQLGYAHNDGLIIMRKR